MELKPNEFDLSYPEFGPRMMVGTTEDDEDSDTSEDSDPAEPTLGSLDRQDD